MYGQRVALVLGILFLCGGCTAIEKGSELNTIPAGMNAATYQGEHDLDSDLCWQDIQAESNTPADADAAHAACMRKRGWVEQP